MFTVLIFNFYKYRKLNELNEDKKKYQITLSLIKNY